MANETLPFAERYGPWALITGGSEGVGGSWASAIAARGVNLVLVARRVNVLEAKATEVRQEHGVEVRTLSVDITSPDLLERLDEVTHDLDIGMLVHNVGSTERNHGWFLDDSLDVTVKTIAVNCVATAEARAHVRERDARAWPGRDRLHGLSHRDGRSAARGHVLRRESVQPGLRRSVVERAR